MDIKIYQINMERGEDLAFMNLERAAKIQGHPGINSSIYDKVFDGLVEADGLSDIWRIFNLEHPDYFKGRSLSISDIVEIKSDVDQKTSFFFCDSFGFKAVDFDPEKTQSILDEKESSKNFIELGCRLGIVLKVTREELEQLKVDDITAQELLVKLIRSDRCEMGGDTYFPGPWNEDYLEDDLNFDLPYSPLHSDKDRKPSLDEKIQSSKNKTSQGERSPDPGLER